MGNRRFYRRGADGVRFRLGVHFGLYIALLSAPFPLLRNPCVVQPERFTEDEDVLAEQSLYSAKVSMFLSMLDLPE